MTIVSCPSCGANLPEDASACTYCGRRVPVKGSPTPVAIAVNGAVPPEQLARSRRVILIALAATIALLALGALVAVLLSFGS